MNFAAETSSQPERIKPVERLQRAAQRLIGLHALLPEDSSWLGNGFKHAGREDITIDEALGLGRHWGSVVRKPEALQALFILFQETLGTSQRKISEAVEREIKAYARNAFKQNLDADIFPEGRDRLFHTVLLGYRGKIPKADTMAREISKNADFLFSQIRKTSEINSGMKLALIKKTEPTSPPTDLVAYRAQVKATPFDARIEELRAMRREVEAKIIEVEKADKGAPISPNEHKVHLRVVALLGEGLSEAPPLQDWEGVLQSLRLDRDAITRAMEILSEKQSVERARRIAAEIQARRDEWDALILDKVLTANKLVALEKRCEDFKTSLIGPGGRPRLPCDVPLPRALSRGEIKTLIETAIREGIISQKEANLP